MALDREQRKIVRLIRREGANIPNLHVRRKYEAAAVETGLVESGLRNLSGGDADSAGWRQERASLYANPTNLRASIRRFRQEFEQHYDPGEKSYEVAAQVQRPAAQYRGRYRDVLGEARAILGSTGGGGSGRSDALGSVSLPGSPALYKPIPGVDNSATRQQAAITYFANSHDPGALLAYKATIDQAQDTPGGGLKLIRGAQSPTGRSQAPSLPGGRVDPEVAKITGTTNFEGKKVAAWIAPALQYARKHGWQGQVVSGFRSFDDQTRIYNSGVRPAARPGTSNHEGANFPRGAVDVSDAQQLSNILRRSKFRKQLRWAGAKDPVHFSHPHGGSY